MKIQLSGLITKMTWFDQIKKYLKDLKEIKIIEFDHNDVVRHPLVSKIIKAYQNKSVDDKN